MLLISIFGMGCSVAIWWGAAMSERELVQTQFRAAASNRALAIQRELDSLYAEARAAGAFLTSRREVDAAELNEFLTSLGGPKGIPLALEYCLRDRSQRIDPNGWMSQWPREGKTNGALLVQCGSGKPQTCLGVRIALQEGSLDLFAPLEALAEKGLSYLAPHGVDVRIEQGGISRYEHLSRKRLQYRHSWWETLRGGIEPFESNWKFHDLDLKVWCGPVPGLLSAASTWQPWGVLVAGLLLTGLLASFFHSLLKHAQNVQMLVAQRTLELEHARDEAVQASTLKSRFLANVSHEVRTPLNGVLGMNRFLLESNLTEAQREYALTIQASGEILLGLMNDLLDLSRIEAGHLELREEPLDLSKTVQTVVDNMGELAYGKNLDFELAIGPEVPAHCVGDTVRLSQILLNLLGNAIKFTERGKVRLSLESVAGLLRIVVTDTGPGIEPELARRLFERFVQADSSDVRRHGGAGLGLSITRELAQLMGGRIWLESELGRGASFFVEIPIHQGSGRIHVVPPPRFRHSRTTASDGVIPPAPCFEGARVLVVEDNHVNQLVTAGMLKRMGVDVDLAGNGLEAVAAFELNRYQLILMDCQMPEMDGFEATRRIRLKEPSSGRIPIVALTANAMNEDRDRCIESGMDDYLAKPLNPGQLVATLQRWCGGGLQPSAALLPS